MNVGQITEGGASFDILEYAETNSVLSRTNGQNRFIYKDEEDQMIILTKIVAVPNNVFLSGSKIIVSDAARGYGEVLPHTEATNVAARTLVDIDWTNLGGFHTRTIVDADGISRTAALIPVRLVAT